MAVIPHCSDKTSCIPTVTLQRTMTARVIYESRSLLSPSLVNKNNDLAILTVTFYTPSTYCKTKNALQQVYFRDISDLEYSYLVIDSIFLSLYIKIIDIAMRKMEKYTCVQRKVVQATNAQCVAPATCTRISWYKTCNTQHTSECTQIHFVSARLYTEDRQSYFD